MPQFSRISFCKLFSRYPFQQSSRPISSIFTKSHQAISNQCLSDSISPPKPSNSSLPISNFYSFLHPIHSNPSVQLRNHGDTRKFSSESVPRSFDQNKEVDEINLKFAEAREEIDMALESKETVYFNEEAECARAAVKEVLDMFDALMAKVSEKEKGVLQRSMGLKMEQLKAELEQLNE